MEEQKSTWQGENRRKVPREKDRLFKVMIGVNILGWLLFVAALIVFHYARPDLISGVQEFWGVDGREQWSQGLTGYLVILLCTCVLMSVAVLFLKRRRNRRKKDQFGIGGFVLLFIAAVSLGGIFWDMF